MNKAEVQELKFQQNGWKLIADEIDWNLYYNKYEYEYKLLDLTTGDIITILLDDIEQVLTLVKYMDFHRIGVENEALDTLYNGENENDN